MKLVDKKKIVVQVFPSKQFGEVIGSNDGLIGVRLNTGDYIDVPQERLKVISESEEETHG